MRTLPLVALLALLTACGSGAPAIDPDPGPAMSSPPLMLAKGRSRAATHPHLTYRGGNLLATAQYTGVYWGAYWLSGTGADDQSFYDSFLGTMAGSARFLSVVQEYQMPTLNQQMRAGAFKGSVQVQQEPGSLVVDGQIQQMLRDQISAGRLPKPDANQVYVVFTPPSTVVDDGTGEKSCGKFCGYHFSFNVAGVGNAHYIVMPHPDCFGCRFALLHDGLSMTELNRDSTTIILSHEMIETVTDPDVGVGKLGWYDDANGEISDICGGSDGYFDQGKLLGFRVQKHWSNADDKCQLERDIPLGTDGSCPAETHASGNLCVPDLPASCSSAGGSTVLALLGLLGALSLRRRRV